MVPALYPSPRHDRCLKVSVFPCSKDNDFEQKRHTKELIKVLLSQWLVFVSLYILFPIYNEKNMRWDKESMSTPTFDFTSPMTYSFCLPTKARLFVATQCSDR